MRAGVGAGEAVDGLGGAHAGDVVQGPVEGANRTESADDHARALNEEEFALWDLEGKGKRVSLRKAVGASSFLSSLD